jgi:hypothetical protein
VEDRGKAAATRSQSGTTRTCRCCRAFGGSIPVSLPT